MQALFRFVSGPDVISSITGWRSQKPASSAKGDGPVGVTDRMLVLAAERDVLCTPAILQDAAQRYQAAFDEVVKAKKIDGVSEGDLSNGRKEREIGYGVSFQVVPRLGHHLQNHVEWKIGAEMLLTWVQKL